MRDFEDSTLWRVSEYERMRQETGTSGFASLEGATLLPTTLLAELRDLEFRDANADVLEMMAACLRHREAALVCVQHEDLVWPITLFPSQMLYHCPRDMLQASAAGMATARVITYQPPGVRPPGHWEHERVAQYEHYRPLQPLLWTMAMHGPRRELLGEISGRAAYRVTTRAEERPPAAGALGSAAERLRREAASLRDLAAWPGMSLERACRLLNALYLASSLMVMRTHPAAREHPDARVPGPPRTRR